ncbi:MAG: hypothetical protein ABUL49_00830 [bacterium]
MALATAAASLAAQEATAPLDTPKGTAVSFPWVFENGTDTARSTAAETGNEILHRAGYASVPLDVAEAAWISHGLRVPTFGHLPTRARLRSFGLALHADKVIYGSVSWHTRSIWVNLGPKTISTAIVDVYVYDVKSGRIAFTRTGVEGRSDETSNNYKVAAAVLFTPLVTAVSGGPATPQEQRAVQIAMGVAYHDWALPMEATR